MHIRTGLHGTLTHKDYFQLNQLIRRQFQEGMLLQAGDCSTSGNINGSEGEFKWHKIWQFKVPNKVKMFVWRLAHNTIKKKCG